MTLNSRSSLVALLIGLLLVVTAVDPAEGHARAPGVRRNRTVRDVTCREGLEYLHGGICCRNCPAGKYVKQPCSVASEMGVCVSCDFGSYTEHENGLLKCLQCTSCRSDQDFVKQCTTTQNTRCQCKAGLYCLPDQACEVCKTCSRCREDEEVEEECTPSSNRVCRKKTSSTRASIAVPITVAVVALGVVLLVVVLYWKGSEWITTAVMSCCAGGLLMKKRSRGSVEARQNGLNAALEDRVQIQPFIVPSQSENGNPRRLIPLNGDESLKKTFDLFEEVDVHYHNRFFRFLGLSDNAIKNAESYPMEERVYQLLKVWMEKEGMKADFNTLIEALLQLNQRLSAESIVARAVSNAYYRYEDD